MPGHNALLSTEHVIERLNLCIERDCAGCERLYHVSNDRPPNDCYSDLLRLARDTIIRQEKEMDEGMKDYYQSFR